MAQAKLYHTKAQKREANRQKSARSYEKHKTAIAARRKEERERKKREEMERKKKREERQSERKTTKDREDRQRKQRVTQPDYALEAEKVWLKYQKIVKGNERAFMTKLLGSPQCGTDYAKLRMMMEAAQEKFQEYDCRISECCKQYWQQNGCTPKYYEIEKLKQKVSVGVRYASDVMCHIWSVDTYSAFIDIYGRREFLFQR